MSDTDRTGLVRRLAELLGLLEIDAVDGEPYIALECFGHCWHESRWDRPMFAAAFAAVARAELAKRGWDYYRDVRTIRGRLRDVCYFGADLNETFPEAFDPTDPVSEAWAVIQCAVEAAEMGEGLMRHQGNGPRSGPVSRVVRLR